MDDAVLVQRLEAARLGVNLGLQLVAEQRIIVGGLEAFGHDAAAHTRRILQGFEKIQERHLENLEFAIGQLEAALVRRSA